ncbi:hypothetical protein HHI36_016242 [Cryptolaemus montrouzieri]|uniref:Uncharacterized protein n=1 Tax=Cryptolaemus montrouzieri TaxID=559131 RepID=A0ABD2NJ46_9CUCU
MSKRKNANCPNSRRRVRFDNHSNSEIQSIPSDEETNRNSENFLTYYFSRLKNLFLSKTLDNEEDIEEETIAQDWEVCRESRRRAIGNREDIENISSQGSSYSISTACSEEPVETDFSPTKMCGNEQTAYQIVKSALKYGYANKIINRRITSFG